MKERFDWRSNVGGQLSAFGHLLVLPGLKVFSPYIAGPIGHLPSSCIARAEGVQPLHCRPIFLLSPSHGHPLSAID